MAVVAVGDDGGGCGSWRLRCRLVMAAVVHMASGGGQPHVGEGRRHSGRLWMRGLASVAATTAAVCGGGGDVGGGEGVGCEARMATARQNSSPDERRSNLEARFAIANVKKFGSSVHAGRRLRACRNTVPCQNHVWLLTLQEIQLVFESSEDGDEDKN
ncbi:hypothetical protein OsJ_08470 [Oryza sativa Japonica Group]|uniref:Uncharacterized protein n=1 Tax=Oryza sativa subsp. japonica TaxID=39947 RepID=A3ABL0_ORYSJ|nr:hypothetical protein OsJ_08470 [Oryza sativa Japonica Group]